MDNKTYQVIIDEILLKIQKREFEVGDKLPSESDLAKHFNISRASVREALSILKSLGLIQMRHGEGAFVSAFSLTPLIDTLSPLLDHSIDIENDILEFRRILEINACALACKAKDKDRLAKIVTKMTMCDLACKQLAYELDMRVHKTIWNMSDNMILIQTMEGIAYLMDHSIRLNRKVIIADDKDGLALVNEHKQIFEAINANDAKMAMEYMNQHLKTERLKEIINEDHRMY